jgi:hypothetical protein
VTTALVLLAVVYLGTVWLDGVGSNLPARLLPRPFVFFAQFAALFKNAGLMAIDYRAEGWSCSEKRWVELDVAPWFPIDADNKESRFHRALQFYRKERRVMQALEAYVIRRNNESSSRPPIVGVRFSSLRIPYPEIGARVERFELKPIASYPKDYQHAWYYTPMSRRRERCGEPPPPPPPKEKEKDDLKDEDEHPPLGPPFDEPKGRER